MVNKPCQQGHVADHISVHIYYGSRNSQPRRVRAFIDMAVEQLNAGRDFLLSSKELTVLEAAGRRNIAKRKQQL